MTITTSSLPISIAPTAEAAGVLVAERILDRYAGAGDRRFHLGCPAGRTPKSTYAALGRLAREREVDLARLVIVMMDEYVVDGTLVPRAAHFSCRRFVDEHVLRHVGALDVTCPDPVDPGAYDEIDIDLFLLASGTSDGHVAFNPPGSPADSETRVVALAQSTRRDNLATFPEFGSIDDVPVHGVTVGLRTIARARESVLVLLGAGKSPALSRLLRCDGFDPTWPVSVIHECSDPWVVVDEAAASGS
jgi:glucosamine-6-phosphate deaminase